MSWRRDPLGPRFQTNFVRAQRFVQISGVMPGNQGAFRLAPSALIHAPTPAKPKRPATVAQTAQGRRDSAAARLSLRGAQQMKQLRQSLDQDPGGTARPLFVAFDGSYTNSTVLKRLPPRTIAIGRIRKDAKLYRRPAPAPGKSTGRPRR